MCDCSALSLDNHLSVTDQNEFPDWLAFACDLGSWLKGSPIADLNNLRQLLTGQLGEGTLPEEMQLLYIPQGTLISD